MKTINQKLKTIVAFVVISFTYTANAQENLAPDQNPNYKRSMEKYMAMKDDLVKTEGTTIQATYKAIDDVQLKQERKLLRQSNRQDRRMARINSRGRNNGYYSPYTYTPYNFGYNNWSPGYNNFGYNNYGYNNFGYNNYSAYGYGTNWSPSCLNWGLLGLGAYLFLR